MKTINSPSWHSVGKNHQEQLTKYVSSNTRKELLESMPLEVPHKLSFVTLFPLAENVHLVKDVGMIPCLMAREQGFDSTLVCFSRAEEMPYLLDEAKPLKVHTIPRNHGYQIYRWPARGALQYLLHNARSINVLHLFHFSHETIVHALFYKVLNPRGKVYIKLDYGISEHISSPINLHTRIRSCIALRLRNAFFTFVPTLMTIESSITYDDFLKSYPAAKNRLKIMPNGIDCTWLDKRCFREKSKVKENLVLAVGRIGTYIKNSEMLLDVITTLNVKDWTFAFVGPVEPDFQKRVNELFEQRPELRSHIILTGNIEDRVELYQWYARAKVFCMTSRSEGFSLAMVDALYFNCYVLTTPVSCAEDITEHSTVGSIIRSKIELHEELQRIINGELDIAAKTKQILKHSERFYWSEICSDLASRLKTSSKKQDNC